MELATKPCPFCAENIQAAAIVCRYCRRDLPVQDAPGAPAPKQPKKKDLPVPIIFLIVAAVVGLAWFGNNVLFKPSGPAAPVVSQPVPIDAFVMCKQFVTDRLKAPATAVFPTYGDDGTQTDQLSSVQFRARAYVDSQNDFGANVRTHYTCTISSTGGKNWQLDDLKIDPSLS